MPRNLESTVSAKDVEYLKSLGILAPDRWPEAPTQAQDAYAETPALSWFLTRECLLAVQRMLDKPGDGPKL